MYLLLRAYSCDLNAGVPSNWSSEYHYVRSCWKPYLGVNLSICFAGLFRLSLCCHQGCFHSLEVGDKEAPFAIAVAILVKPPVKESLFMRLLLRMKALICSYLANYQRAPVFQGACLPFLPPAGNKKIKMKQLWTIAVILLTALTECFGQTAWYAPM